MDVGLWGHVPQEQPQPFRAYRFTHGNAIPWSQRDPGKLWQSLRNTFRWGWNCGLFRTKCTPSSVAPCKLTDHSHKFGQACSLFIEYMSFSYRVFSNEIYLIFKIHIHLSFGPTTSVMPPTLSLTLAFASFWINSRATRLDASWPEMRSTM